MKKSKFLKKSLAALLAILMVAAMIPLSAAAEEAPEPEGPKAPTITVNNATATAPTEEGGAYTATVRDATTVSISWINAEDDYSAWIRTARGVSVAVPFRALDLLTEGSTKGEGLGEDADGNVTYQVHFELKAKDATAQSDAIKSYPLNIKVLASVPNDDTTIRVVRPNQEFRLDNVQHKFIGVSAEPVDNVNNVITITLPLGIPFGEAGFGNYFGFVNGTVNDAWPGTLISGSSVAQINKNNAVARRVFVPNSVYSTVRYIAPTKPTGDGTLTVTSRDGHSRNYTVRFVQEDALYDVAVGGVKGVKSIDSNGIVTYTIDVGSALTNDSYQDFTVTFGKLDNVVRVEDPILDNNTYASAGTLWRSGTISGQNHNDNPVRSNQNKIRFVASAPGKNATEKYAYLTVKTQANMAPNTEQMGIEGPDLESDGIVDGNFFQDVKIVLRKSDSVSNTGAALTELQLNGYESIWNYGNPLELDDDGEIKIYVDYDFQFTTGDGQHPARISGTVKGTHVSIPAQDSSQVQDDYWRVGKQAVTSAGRITKPDDDKFDLGNVNTEDGKVTLRVWNGGEYTDYPLHIIKVSNNFDTKVSGVHLYQKQSDGTYKLAYDATSSTGKNWQFKLPDNLYANTRVSSGASSTLTGPFPTPNPGKPLSPSQPVTTVPNFAGTGYQFDMYWNDNTDVQYQDAIKEVLEQKIAEGALGVDGNGDPYVVDENATVKDNADLYLVEGDKAGEVDLVSRVSRVDKNGAVRPQVDVVIATGVFSSSIDGQALGLPEVKDQIIFYTPNGTHLATGKFSGIKTPAVGAVPAAAAYTVGSGITLATSQVKAADAGASTAEVTASLAFTKANLDTSVTAQVDAALNSNVKAGIDLADYDITVDTYLKQNAAPLTIELMGVLKFTKKSDSSVASNNAILTDDTKATFSIAKTDTIQDGSGASGSVVRDLLNGGDTVATITFANAGGTSADNTLLDNLTTTLGTWPGTQNNINLGTGGSIDYTLGTPAVPAVMQPVNGRTDWLGTIKGLSPVGSGVRAPLYTNATITGGRTNTLELYGEFNPGPNAGAAIATALYNLTTATTPVLTADELGKATSVQLFAKLIGDARAPQFELYAKLTGSSPQEVKIATVDAPVVFKNGKASVNFDGIGTLDFTAVNHYTGGTGDPSWSYMADNDPANEFFAMIGTNAGGLAPGSATGTFKKATYGSVITVDYTIPGTDGTTPAKVLAGLRTVSTGVALLNNVRYTGSGSSEFILNKDLQDYMLVIDTPQGAVVTPGGAAKNGRSITEQVGVSLWNNGNGFNEGWPARNVYTELEEGVTTLGSWWLADTTNDTTPAKNNVYDYTRNQANNGAGAGINTDTLYFTVKNGYDGPESVYTITLAGTTNTTYPSIADELDITGAIATSAIDEDLVYGGNSVTNAILVRDGALCALPSINNGVVSNKFSASFGSFTPTGPLSPPNTNVNPGWINPANAAYINDIGGNNLYSNITITPLTNEKNASVVTIEVPANFGTGTYGSTNAPNSLFFEGLTAAANSTVYRLVSDGTVTEDDSAMKKFNLDTKNQNQQGNIADEFGDDLEFIFRSTNDVFDDNSPTGAGGSRQDMDAWNGSNFDSSKVSRDNIIYVVSADAKRASSFPQIVNERNIETLSSVHNGHKYYITVRRQNKSEADDLKSLEAAENTKIDVIPNNSLKTLELHVPATYDWAGYRDNASKDFQLNFELSEGALLIDAYRDPAFGFKDNKNVSPNLYADFSLTDLTKEMQEAYKWVSYTDKEGNENDNYSTFFVKNGELYMINTNTGIETQITGMGDEISDYFIDSRWSQIMAKEAELRIYNEARNQVNTYKLKLVIDPVSSVAEITDLTVNESTAVVDNENRKATVTLPSDTDLEAVKLSIAVSPQARIISIAGEAYNPNDKEATYDITEGITIVIAAGDDVEYTYNLIVDGSEEPVPADATITSLTVDGVAATVNNTARTAEVELPEGSDLSKVKLAIEVSEGDELVSVAGEEFDPEADYDLSDPIAIVIEAEDGTKYDYTLTGTVAQPVDPVNPADKYTDLEKITDEKTRNEVKEAINLGLMNGISESKGIFGVGIKMERYQFALVVARADIREQLLAEDANADVSTEALNKKLVELYPDNYTFTDVAEKVPQKAAAAAVEYCYKKGYINGKSLANKIFDPNGQITREEAAKIMVGWAGLAHDDTDVSAIPDGDQISNWAKGYVKAAYDAGIVKGYSNGNFGPKDALNREYGACMLVRTYKDHIVNKGDDDNTPDDGDDNNGDDDTNTPDDDENNGDDSSTPDDGDNSSTPDEGGDDDTSSTPDDGDTSSTPDEGGESEPAE